MKNRFARSSRIAAFAPFLWVGLLNFIAAPALAATFTVTTSEDSSSGSLRQAINDANLSVDESDTITFNIPTDPGATTVVIAPQSPLPAITKGNVSRDGLSQVIFSGARVALDGSQAGATTNGLQMNAASNASGTVSRLEIRKCRRRPQPLAELSGD